ncbi:MAG TPA: hypothetical protein VGC42_23630 [Kofleriaceae bacterium]
MSPLPRRPFPRAAALLVVVLGLGAPAVAAPAKKFHFELLDVTAKSEIKPDIAQAATPRIKAQVEKVFAGHPQLVAKLDGAPDPAKNAEGYRRWLTQKNVSGSYLVSVEITDADEELEPMEGKPNTQRLTIKVAIHMLGEHIPGRTIGFTGDGKATIKQEIGMKLRDRDREDTWNAAAEVAVDDAMKRAFQQLGAPQKK